MIHLVSKGHEMPNPTMMGGTQQKTSGPNGRGKERAVVPTVPFIRASAQHREPSGIDVQRAITAADQELGVFDIPAYGYVRALVITVDVTGGTGTSVTTAEDGPWTVLKNVALTEPNGAVIHQFNSGYEMHLAGSKYGGYRHVLGSDLKASPTFSAVGASTGNFTLMYRIPVELNERDGLGSLPNQNAAAVFKLRLTLAAAATIYGGTVPSTLPTARVRIELEAWDQPEASTAGQVNQITPPAMNTTQFWSSQVYNINAGQQTVRLTRVGNYIRNLIFIYRNAALSRSAVDANWPDPMTIYLDTRPLDIVRRTLWKHQMYERSGYGGSLGATVPAADSPRGLDNSVFAYDFLHEFDGTYGYENRDLWLPTLGSSRLELQGNFGTAGTLTVLTNDVSIAGSVFI